MPTEPAVAETPLKLRERAGRYRVYACYYYNDPAYQVLVGLANELEIKAMQIERLGAATEPAVQLVAT